jgi:hypothetical protein
VRYKITNPKLYKENVKAKEKLVTGLDGGLTPGQTGRLTVGRKITLTLTCPSPASYFVATQQKKKCKTQSF